MLTLRAYVPTSALQEVVPRLAEHAGVSKNVFRWSADSVSGAARSSRYARGSAAVGRRPTSPLSAHRPMPNVASTWHPKRPNALATDGYRLLLATHHGVPERALKSIPTQRHACYESR